MTSFESFPPVSSEQALSAGGLQHGDHLTDRAELLSELHATRLVLSRTEQMLEKTRLELSAQATLRQAYEEARSSCSRMEALLRTAAAEAEQWKAEHARAAEGLRQIQATTYWRIGLRLKAFLNRHPLLRRVALLLVRRLRG